MAELLTPAHLIVMFFFLLVPYFIPTIVTFSRKVANPVGILLLNVFLGWTVLGWIGALIWAVTAETEEAVRRREIELQLLAAVAANRDRVPPQP